MCVSEAKRKKVEQQGSEHFILFLRLFTFSSLFLSPLSPPKKTREKTPKILTGAQEHVDQRVVEVRRRPRGPLEQDQEAEIPKQRVQEEHLRDELGQRREPVALAALVEQTHSDPGVHLDHAEHDAHLHLDRVEELELGARAVPGRVDARPVGQRPLRAVPARAALGRPVEPLGEGGRAQRPVEAHARGGRQRGVGGAGPLAGAEEAHRDREELVVVEAWRFRFFFFFF